MVIFFSKKTVFSAKRKIFFSTQAVSFPFEDNIFLAPEDRPLGGKGNNLLDGNCVLFRSENEELLLRQTEGFFIGLECLLLLLLLLLLEVEHRLLHWGEISLPRCKTLLSK